MTRTETTKGQALWQPGGAEEDSCFHEGDRHLCLAYDEEEEEDYLSCDRLWLTALVNWA